MMQHVLVKFEAPDFLRTLLAFVLFVLAGREPSLLAARAREVSIRMPVMLHNLHVPCVRVEHVLTRRAAVAVGGQALIPLAAFVAPLAF